MTVSSTQSYIEYNSDGVTTVFTIPFYFLFNSDISAMISDTSGNISELVNGADFTVTGAGDSGGGALTLGTPTASGDTLLIYRNPPVTQETKYYENGKFPAASHEAALDKLTMLIQNCFGWERLALLRPSIIANHYDAVNYPIRNLSDPSQPQDAATKNYVDGVANFALRTPEPIPALPSAEDRKNKIVGMDGNGNPIMLLPESGSAADVLLLLAADDGYKRIPSVFRVNSDVPVESFRSSGLTDQQIVQQANDYAASVGRDLLFEAGRTYTVTSVTATCKWKGKGTIKRGAGTTSDMVNVGNGGSLKGLIIDGSADTLTSSPNTVLVSANTRFDIDGIRVFNSPGQAVSVLNTPATFAPSRIFNCSIEGSDLSTDRASAGSGIYLYNALNIHTSGNKITKKANGILAQGNKRNVSRLSFSENTIYQCFGGALGLVLMSEAADQQAYEKVIIEGNHFYKNGETGLAVQCDLTVVTNNIITDNGTQTYHQGVLVNANGVIVSNNIITDNAGVGIDFGDCRKCSATANHIENNGWIGIEINSCEQVTVTGNVLNLNFRGQAGADLQAAILVHTGNGGYPFLGDTKNITIIGNTINSGAGQQYAILIADTSCYNVVVSGNNCKLVGLVDDIVSRSSDVTINGNNTRWDPMGTPRASISSGICAIPSVADTVQVNGTGSVTSLTILNSGSYIKDRYVRIYSINGLTLENSGATSTGNLFLGSAIVLAAGDSVRLWSNGSGGWKRA